MIVRVLGSAAGGGVPQWNCACANCADARAGRAPRRTQSGLAIAPDDRGPWLLLNCSPDIAMQVEAFARLHPAQGRSTPLAGVLLTDANLDHVGGLAVLRQAGPRPLFRVRSSATVKAICSRQPSFAHFAAAPHRWIEVPLDGLASSDGDDDLVGNRLMVRAFAVPGATPGYDGRRNAAGAVVAYEIADRGSDHRLLFAPVFGDVDDALAEAVAGAKVAFLDGSFFSDDELHVTTSVPKSARSMGHMPVGGYDGTLARLRNGHGRTIFTHLNNSNPMLDPTSAASATVRDFGAEIAYDGMEVTL